MISIRREINYSWWVLRTVYAVTFIGAGVDKFLYRLVDWRQFVHPATELMLGLSDSTIIYVVGIVEIALGIALCTQWVKTATLCIAAWMIANGLYLIAFRMYLDTALRYCVLGIVAIVFFHITRVREKLMHS